MAVEPANAAASAMSATVRASSRRCRLIVAATVGDSSPATGRSARPSGSASAREREFARR